MKCYNDIYNLCASCNNPFEYTSQNNSILMKDKSTNIEYNLNEIGKLTIASCDYSTEYRAVDYYTCYDLYLQYCSSAIINKSSTASQINDTISILNDTFNHISNNIIKTTGSNSTDIFLSTTVEDLIHLGNIATLSSLLYEKNQTSDIPHLVDSLGTIRKIDFSNLYNILYQYTSNSVNNYYIQQDLQKLLKQDNLDSVANCDICGQDIPKSSASPSTLVDDFVVDVLPELDLEVRRCSNLNPCPAGYTCSNGICVKSLPPCPNLCAGGATSDSEASANNVVAILIAAGWTSYAVPPADEFGVWGVGWSCNRVNYTNCGDYPAASFGGTATCTGAAIDCQ